ncbi:MAG: hypothetical protein ACFFG0_15550 [Candidatus Thorarchaeota archaeon]
MKLIFCPKCQDVRKLQLSKNISCSCGCSGGMYLNDLNAIYFGDAIPIGFSNSSFAKAIRNQPEEGQGGRFEAFIIPKKCNTFKKLH